MSTAPKVLAKLLVHFFTLSYRIFESNDFRFSKLLLSTWV
jgi:hypothetical protein